ncbi:MAG: hypothetical protein M0R17_08475 [Candidatus Omnitrophica bacterium]|jgi:hypothetical protein|nr:hypothetical protein [Candidatus Omnitrophota bacterium]
MKTKIEELEQTIKTAQSQIEQIKQEQQSKNLNWYIEEYIKLNEDDFSNSKIEKLKNHNFNHVDVVGIFESIVADLNQGWKPNFTSSNWRDWGYCIYHSIRNGGHSYYGVAAGGFSWNLYNAAGNAAQYIGARSLFKSKELAEKAIEIMGTDFLNLLFE